MRLLQPCVVCGHIESIDGSKEKCVRCLTARIMQLERAGRHIRDELMGQVNEGAFRELPHSSRIYLVQLAGVAADPTKLR